MLEVRNASKIWLANLKKTDNSLGKELHVKNVFILFSLALQPGAGYGLLVHEVS
jgi:hypothetical protein